MIKYFLFVIILGSTFALADGILMKPDFIPDRVYSGDVLEFDVVISNNDNSFKKIEMVSYVYWGHDVASFGWDGNEWSFGKDANTITITLLPGEERTITLRNKILDDSRGNHILRIKYVDDKRWYDYEKNIYIMSHTSLEDQAPTGLTIENEPFLSSVTSNIYILLGLIISNP